MLRMQDRIAENEARLADMQARLDALSASNAALQERNAKLVPSSTPRAGLSNPSSVWCCRVHMCTAFRTAPGKAWHTAQEKTRCA